MILLGSLDTSVSVDVCLCVCACVWISVWYQRGKILNENLGTEAKKTLGRPTRNKNQPTRNKNPAQII